MEESEKDVPSVIIARRPCALLVKKKTAPCAINTDKCRKCGMCMKIGCPAMTSRRTNGRGVDPMHLLCNGCGLCKEMCHFGAIRRRRGVNA